MKLNKHINNIIGAVLTICLTIGLLAYATRVCERKDATFRFNDFFSEMGDIDVMFYGSSHMINGVFPNYLWRDYGISAYNFGSHADYLPSSYWVMRNTFDYVNPKLVVIDCYTISEQFKVCSYEFWHGWNDVFPLSGTKLSAIKDLTDDPLKDELIADGSLDASSKGTTGEMIWDFAKYHSRWSSLNDEDFHTPHSLERGAEARVNVYPMEDPDKISKDRVYSGNPIAITYLDKMIDYCQDRGIEVLLVYIPYAADENRQMQANRAGKIAEEQGVNYINFLDMDIVDYSIDYYDDTHLNTSGAAKVTDYLGQYITEHYNIENKWDDASYSHNFEYYDKYVDSKMDSFDREGTLHGSLLLAKDNDFDIILDIEDAVLWEDSTSAALIESMGAHKKDLKDGTGYIVIEAGNGDVNCYEELPASLSDFLVGEYGQQEATSDDGLFDDAMESAAYTGLRIVMINPKNSRVVNKLL